MVLRKDRPPCGVENSSGTMSNEQPVTKRQRIENAGNAETEADAPPAISTVPSTSSVISPQDGTIIISKNNNNIDTDSSAQQNSSDETDNAAVSVKSLIIPSVASTTTDNSIQPSTQKVQNNNVDADLLAFQQNLLKQCLCGVSERTLKRPFQSHYNPTTNGLAKRIATLSEWPNNKLIQFLSNLQLLFDVYLKQNKTGSICSRIKDVCDALQLNEHNLINEIIDLSQNDNKYVQYLAGRVMSSFLVIAQYSQYCNDWLKKLVDNLFSFEVLDTSATQNITFSLDIFKRIVEWKDVDEHPLDDEMVDPADENEIPYVPPPIENNYFNFYNEYAEDTTPVTLQTNRSTNSRTVHATPSTSSQQFAPISPPSQSAHNHHHHQHTDNLCHMIHLTDYDTCDTTKLKCDTVKIIENKWPALLRNMNTLISSYRGGNEYDETLILTFLELWKSIISVQANLSVNDTHPFHAQLDNFEKHLSAHLPPTIYKQMLTLFNEALCYGSTLALQDIIPEDTCKLAHRIINHIKDDTLLNSVPVRSTENPVSLIAYVGRTMMPSTMPNRTFRYDGGDDHYHRNHHHHHNNEADNEENDSSDDTGSKLDTYGLAIDKTFLQKMVLLVLKSVAVMVREMRSDSSDSSIDSNDHEAYNDLILIETNIRIVLKKLHVFTKNKLQLFPDYHFSKMLVYLFDDQDDFLIEAMVCTLDVTAGFTIRTTAFTENPFAELIRLLNPVYTFLEFLFMTMKSVGLLLDLLVSNETCFLLYLLRFLKYIKNDWNMFDQYCQVFGNINGHVDVCDEVMTVLRDLRCKITRMVTSSTFPYDISPIVRLLETCENLHEGEYNLR